MRTTSYTWLGSALLILLVIAAPLHAATFPITEDFSGSQPADWELRANASWATTVDGTDTLRLTDAVADQNGLGFYDVPFASDLGIVAEFDYYADGGDGADGIAFFLVDGDQVSSTTIAAGAFGGALGYAQNETEDGIPHAYLGVGFDEFGNFVTNDEGKSGGVGSTVPDSVGLRGSGNGSTGYDYLTHTDVSSSFGQRIDGGWRTARVTVIPGSSDATVRVEMSWDGGSSWETVIDDYTYTQAPPTNLKLGFTGSTGGSTNIHAIGEVEVTIPADLQVTTTDGGSAVTRGKAVNYRYTVTNNGPNDTPTTTVTNSMPLGSTGFTDVSWSYTSTHGPSAAGDDADLSPLTLSLPSGDSATVSVTSTVGSSVVDSTDLTVTVQADTPSDMNDPNPGSESVTFSFTPDAPTQAESDALDLLSDYAVSSGTTTAPTVSDYSDAGVTGVTSDTLAATNQYVADSGEQSFSTAADIQGFADKATAFSVITDYATSGGTTTAPTVNDYSDAGVTGVTSDTLAATNEYIATQDAGTVDDVSSLQDSIDTVEATEKIKTYAGTDGTSAAPTVADYQQVGATSVTADNLKEMNDAVAAKAASEVGSVATIRTATEEAATEIAADRDSGGIIGRRSPGNRAVDTSNTRTPATSNADASTPTATALAHQLTQLRARVQELFTELHSRTNRAPQTTATPSDTSDTSSQTIPTRDLSLGMSGADVTALQSNLIDSATGPATRELERVGATGYFGAYTENALSEYQQENGIRPPAGYYGSITRAAMRAANDR